MLVKDLKPGLRPMERAPKNAAWIIVWSSKNGWTASPTAVHWAEDLSGSEQPPFRGWFYDSGYGFSQFDPEHAIGWHPTCERAREVAELKMTAIADRKPERYPFGGEQTILTYSEGCGVFSLETYEAGEDFDDVIWSGSHWMDITGMWPGVHAQVAAFGEENNRDLEHVLRECRRIFVLNARYHREKSPPDVEKASVNRRLVDLIDDHFPWLLFDDAVIAADGSVTEQPSAA